MIDKKTWKEFRTTGLVMFMNSFLHIFGWAIVFVLDAKGEVTEVYPARVNFRGFDDKTTTEEHVKVAQYLKYNIDDLLKEAKE